MYGTAFLSFSPKIINQHFFSGAYQLQWLNMQSLQCDELVQ